METKGKFRLEKSSWDKRHGYIYKDLFPENKNRVTSRAREYAIESMHSHRSNKPQTDDFRRIIEIVLRLVEVFTDGG